jgi:hypothetical protein
LFLYNKITKKNTKIKINVNRKKHNPVTQYPSLHERGWCDRISKLITMETSKLTEKELDIIYGFLNLEWDDMPQEVKEEWIKVLTEIENKQDETD